MYIYIYINLANFNFNFSLTSGCEATSGQTNPRGQSSHTELPLSEYVPCWHLIVDVLFGQANPLEHALHVTAPSKRLIVPEEQTF